MLLVCHLLNDVVDLTVQKTTRDKLKYSQKISQKTIPRYHDFHIFTSKLITE